MDWKKMISELSGAGYTQARIAQELGKAQSWVADVAKGRYADLKWSDGQKLIAFHSVATSHETAEATNAQP